MTIEMPEVIRYHRTHIRTPEGLAYAPRVVAAETGGELWEAWLEFHPIDGNGPVLRTERETTQASRDAIEVWASGLEAAYLEGAFGRAQLVTPR